MDSLPRRVLLLILLFHVLAYGALFAYDAASFSPKEIDPAFRWEWTAEKALVQLIGAIIPIQCTGVLVGYSLPARRARRRDSISRGTELAPFYRVITSSLRTFLVLALLFTALSEGARPRVNARLDELAAQSSLARELTLDYRTANSAGRLSDAKRYLDLYREIVPSDQKARDESNELTVEIARSAPSRTSPAPSGPERSFESQSASELLSRARGLLAQGDAASADWYAELSQAIEPSAAARSLAAEAMARLSSLAPSAEERDRRLYYERKSLGRSLLEDGDAIEAYYLFLGLKAAHPGDNDVAVYLRKSTSQLLRYAFFRDEIDRLLPFPGVRDVVFAGRGPEGSRDIDYFGKIVRSRQGVYFADIETIRISAQGQVLYHLEAPFGKLQGRFIDMRCIARDEDVTYGPTLIEGALPPDDAYRIPLDGDIGTIERLGVRQADFSEEGLVALWRLAGTVENYGYLKQPLQVEILGRLLGPFAFLILSIFSIGVGWSLRGRPRVLAYLFVPAFPFVLSLAVELYEFATRQFFGFLLTSIDFQSTLVVFAAAQFALLFIALFYVAGKSAVAAGAR